jgi:serine/threonine protein kinase
MKQHLLEQNNEYNEIHFGDICYNKFDTKGDFEKSFSQLIGLMKSLFHPHLVRYYDRDLLCNLDVDDYRAGISLNSIINERRYDETIALADKGFPTVACLLMFVQISDALRYLHQQNIIHCQVEPSNIFFDGNTTYKLGNLGSAIQLSQSEMALKQYGFIYSAWEMLKNEPYNSAVDIWSLGVALFCYATGAQIAITRRLREFEIKESDGAILDMNSGKFTIQPKHEKIITSKLGIYNLFTQCVQINPKKRPTGNLLVKEGKACLSLATDEKQQAFEKHLRRLHSF